MTDPRWRVLYRERFGVDPPADVTPAPYDEPRTPAAHDPAEPDQETPSEHLDALADAVREHDRPAVERRAVAHRGWGERRLAGQWERRDAAARERARRIDAGA